MLFYGDFTCDLFDERERGYTPVNRLIYCFVKWASIPCDDVIAKDNIGQTGTVAINRVLRG